MNRTVGITVLASLLALPAVAQDIVWRVAPETIPDLRAYAQQKHETRNNLPASDRESITGKISSPDSRIFLPAYQVDTTDPGGETTVFAVRNVNALDQDIQILYFDKLLNLLTTQVATLGQNQVLPINLRDVSAVTEAAEADGFARGFVRIQTSGNSLQVLTGDYFQVNPGQNFATGGRLLELNDFCDHWGIRYLNGGVFTGGTDFRMLVNFPLGGDPDVDDPTLTINVLNESGAILSTVFGYTDNFVFEFSADEIVGNLATSGSLSIFVAEDTNGGGILFGNFSANGRFSVGIDGVCEPPIL